VIRTLYSSEWRAVAEAIRGRPEMTMLEIADLTGLSFGYDLLEGGVFFGWLAEVHGHFHEGRPGLCQCEDSDGRPLLVGYVATDKRGE
jgi:hypothetical protein